MKIFWILLLDPYILVKMSLNESIFNKKCPWKYFQRLARKLENPSNNYKQTWITYERHESHGSYTFDLLDYKLDRRPNRYRGKRVEQLANLNITNVVDLQEREENRKWQNKKMTFNFWIASKIKLHHFQTIPLASMAINHTRTNKSRYPSMSNHFLTQTFF